ncbi:MAG: 4-hydroxy-tetrahydrodipicolinate synthase [Ruminococcaceae bacterium]|nr:4-hydroxy-tetrahydrodipicolinate synthase [Oscillospiraceae bacterium]
MKKTIFKGSATALVTPINEKGVNFDALEKMIEFQIAQNTDALVICGTTGEAPTLEDSEHLDAIECAVSASKGRIPVIAGTGSNNTAHAIMMNKEAQKRGADALLWVAPYYNKSTQRGLVKHYQSLAASTDLPAILYNVPSRTGSDIKAETVEELSKVENIVAIKEASGDVARSVDIIARCGENIDVYSGNDDIIVPMMSVGAKGVISVLSNVVPKDTHEMCMHCLNGDYEKATKLQLKYFTLVKALFCEVNPIPVKTAMNLMGFDAGILRLPLYEMEEKNFNLLKEIMKSHGLIK